MWSLTDNNVVFQKTLKENKYTLFEVEAIPTTDQVVSCSEDGKFQLWNSDGNCIDTYSTNDEEQFAVHCHGTLPFVALGTEKALVILALYQQKTNFKNSKSKF